MDGSIAILFKINLFSLSGDIPKPKGEKGERGVKGTAGEVGPKGPTGDDGPRGQTGFTGAKGQPGSSGQLDLLTLFLTKFTLIWTVYN